MHILAIETSCDETGVAIVRKSDIVTVVAEAVASQIDIHKETGGVVPEVAAREHVRVIRPLIEKVLREADMSEKDIEAIAVTVGPGLMPALSVGVQAARTLAYAWGKQIIPVHHLEGHVYSALLQGEIRFPALALIVSGGHTMLVEMDNHLTYRVLGSTRDDAAGEVFDKVGRMLNLPYPGGPHISALAQSGDGAAYAFPRPMMDSGDLDFSYSGLKTAVLYEVRGMDDVRLQQKKADIAASFEQAVVDSLVRKTGMAMERKQYETVLLAGGVAANTLLREELAKAMEDRNTELRIAPAALCGDNAVMIGMCAAYAYEQGRVKRWSEIDATARVSIEEFSA